MNRMKIAIAVMTGALFLISFVTVVIARVPCPGAP